MTTVRHSVQAFADRDLTALSDGAGLAAQAPLNDVAEQLNADPAQFGRHFLGRPPRESFWCPATVDGFDGPVRIWFRDGRVVKIEGEWPDLTPDDVAALGPPEAELDYRRDVAVVTGGEKLWAARGVAIKLNRSGRQVIALSVFPATTVDGFTAGVRGADDYRESPAP
jgi:hypothetical protein